MRTYHLNVQELDASRFAEVRGLPAGPADNGALVLLADADGDAAKLLRPDVSED